MTAEPIQGSGDLRAPGGDDSAKAQVAAEIGGQLDGLVVYQQARSYAQLLEMKGDLTRRLFDTIDSTRDATLKERASTRRGAFMITMAGLGISFAIATMGFVLFLADKDVPGTAFSSAGLAGMIASAMSGLARLSTTHHDLIPELPRPESLQ